MSKHQMTQAEAERLFRGSLSENPQSLPEIFNRLSIPTKYRLKLTALMTKLVHEGSVRIIPGDDRWKTSPSKYHLPATSHKVHHVG